MGWAVEVQWLTLLIGVAAFVINTAVVLVTTTWKLANVRKELSEDIIAHRDGLKEELAMDRRIIGESLNALRQKINDVELYAANNYVRREAWHQAMNQLQTQLQQSDKAAEERVDRLEAKIDRITERLSAPPLRS